MERPKRFFGDTSALIAVLDHQDQHHAAIEKFYKEHEDPFHMITSNLVLSEFLTYFSRCSRLNSATRFQKKVLEDPTYEVIWVDRPLQQAATDILLKFSDQRLSFTDASSFAIMRQLKITQALTFDDDFKRAGFEMFPQI